ncbi:hypothetical protein N0V88_001916 [Collariella sp. IMI 366227]|nr:hypothetical protein N0V88_001916 [Collariella sp. IMI 366227]
MTSQNPSTPVKVPSSAANYTAATLDPDLRSQINSILIKEGHVTNLHLRRVLEDVRQDTAMAPNGNNTNGNGNAAVNGEGGVNGKKAEATNGTSSNNNNGTGPNARQSLAVPQTVVDEALKVTRGVFGCSV